MLTVGVIGVGNAGSQVTELAATNGIDGVVINSSENDLSTISDNIQKFPLGDLRGAGKDRNEAKKFLKDSIRKLLEEEKFQKFMCDKDVVFVVSSTGGGTGSGISPLLTQILKKAFQSTLTILVGILPTLDEAYSTQINTLEYTTELYQKIESPIYMMYDNDKFKGQPSYKMMEEINASIVRDIKILQGTYNYPTKYSSIDEKDMTMILSTAGRIVVSAATEIKEKDLGKLSIDSMIEDNLREGAHAELQLDRVIKRSGVIANLSQNMVASFDDHLLELQKFIGSPVEEFGHISINEDKALSNAVYFIGAGLSPIVDRISKINERVMEIESMQNAGDDVDEVLGGIDLSKANSKRSTVKAPTDKSIDVNSIFEAFM